MKKGYLFKIMHGGFENKYRTEKSSVGREFFVLLIKASSARSCTRLNKLLESKTKTKTFLSILQSVCRVFFKPFCRASGYNLYFSSKILSEGYYDGAISIRFMYFKLLLMHIYWRFIKFLRWNISFTIQLFSMPSRNTHAKSIYLSLCQFVNHVQQQKHVSTIMCPLNICF